MATIHTLREVLKETLQLGERANHLEEDTMLLGNIPELDSMAVVELVAQLESSFGIAVDDEDITAENFQTMGSLIRLIEERQ